MRRRGAVTSPLYFNVSNTAAEVFWSRSPDRYMRLRYEDFVARPIETLRSVGDFVGEDFDISPLFADGSVSVRPTHSVWGNPTRFEHGLIPIAPDTAWRAAMPAWRQAVTTVMTWPLMLRYGYLRPDNCRDLDRCSRPGGRSDHLFVSK